MKRIRPVPGLPARVEVRHLDLAGGFTDLPRVRGEGVYLVFWWHDLPLGHARIPAAQLPMSPSELERLFRTRGEEEGWFGGRTGSVEALANLYEQQREREAAAPRGSWSLVICTRDRPEDLRRCLNSIAALTPGPDETIVVDNAPHDDLTRRVVEELAVTRIRYVREPRPGLSIARNTGLRHAGGTFVAFTDDDVEVHPKWLMRLQAAFEAPDVWAVTGRVIPAVLETKAQQLFESMQEEANRGAARRVFDPGFLTSGGREAARVWDIGAGASMAFRRTAFTTLGGFDQRLGAGAAGCSEDSELWYRILAAGKRCVYEPAAVVFHHHRADMRGLRRQMYHYLRGHVVALFVQWEQYRDRGSLWRAFRTLPRYYGQWMLWRARGAAGGPVLLGAQVRGFLAGFSFYLRHRADPGAPVIEEPA